MWVYSLLPFTNASRRPSFRLAELRSAASATVQTRHQQNQCYRIRYQRAALDIVVRLPSLIELNLLAPPLSTLPPPQLLPASCPSIQAGQ